MFVSLMIWWYYYVMFVYFIGNVDGIIIVRMVNWNNVYKSVWGLVGIV